MELSKIQEKVVKAKEKFIVVNSGAGSGKTRTLAERVKYLLRRGIPASKIVVITFTNAAAETMMERIGEAPGLHCSTVHSYANFLLRAAGVDTSKILNEEEFDKLFNLVKRHPECIQEVEYLLLDEGQDSTRQQFEFMLEKVNPKNWMIFSDHRQSIYRFAGAYPDYIISLMERPDVYVYDLNENYRNAPQILEYAQSLIMPLGYDYKDRSVSMREEDGRVVVVEYSKDGIASTIRKYVKDGRAQWSDWFVLTRTNSELSDILSALNKHSIPCDTFKRANLDNKGLKEKMKENTVKVLTVHTAKGLEAKNVIVIGTNYRNTEERCLCYVAATRAEDLLVWTIKKTRHRNKQGITNWE